MLQQRELRTRTNPAAEGFSGYTISARVNTFTAMLNGYVDGHNDTIFTPYLMAGIGVSGTNTRFTAVGPNIISITGRVKRTNLVWNAGLGAQAKVTDRVSLDLSYRYVNLGRFGTAKNFNFSPAPSIRVKLHGELRTHEVLAGLIWHF